MTHKTRRTLLFIAYLCIAGAVLYGPFWAGSSLSAEASAFVGLVTNTATGDPVPDAQISAAGHMVRADEEGRYTLPLGPGEYAVRAQAPGYVSMTHTRQRIGHAARVALDFEMVPRHPSRTEAVVIDEKMRRLAQDPPPELTEGILSRGYQLSAVTKVPSTLRVLMPDGSVVVMGMDEYLKGVVPQEVPVYWPPEALRAQAVAARSYAATRHAHSDEGADVCTTTHCQVWGSTHYDTTDRAVDDTHGVVARDGDNKIIYAFFFGHCDGHTRNSEDVWGGYLPYCRSVSCPCGYTTMWGHGVGMCQQGARVFAERGYSYVDILRHYYTGITVTPSAPGHIGHALVYPLSGDENTQFVYEATYTSEIGDLPAVANVIIDDHARAMERIPGSSEDSWRYRFTTRLPAGAHTFRFYFNDGYGHISTVPVVGAFTGPVVTEPDRSTPTPTPLPTPPGGAKVHNVTCSTTSDWMEGTLENTCVVEIGDGALTLADGVTEGLYTSHPVTVPFPFVALGLTWYAETPPGTSLAFEVRTSPDGLTWGDWQVLAEAEDDPGRHDFRTSDLLFGLGETLQFRVALQVGAEGTPLLLKNLRLVCIDSRPGPTALELTTAQRRGSAERPPALSRAAWGADESLMTWPAEYRSLRAVILHHTASGDDGMDPAALVRAIYYYHSIVREWGDIGYNYLMDRYGNVYEGRAGGVGVVGAHARRFNYGSIGVALLGDYHEQDVPTAMLDGLTEFLAWQCADHFIHPTEERRFIDTLLPNIMGHRDCGTPLCPGDQAYALLPTIRSETLSKMSHVPPHVALAVPAEGDAVRAVVDVSLQASAAITQVDYFVDGVQRASDLDAPFTWKWNTLDENEGTHRLRVVAQNSAGQDGDEAQVMVDNTSPGGSASVAPWHNSTYVAFALSGSEATSVQFSNNWAWEGEDLYHEPGTGHVVADAEALNGQAWHGRAGVDQPGGWYGPYTCALPSWRDYDIVFRLRTPDCIADVGLATLDVADNQVDGGNTRVYALRSLASRDFGRDDTYEDFSLPLAYCSKWPTCEDPDISDGLEFRTWFSGAGDLTLDRVTVFGAPQTLSSSPLYWTVRDVEGAQTVIVRFRDRAGNATDRVLTINLDMTPPQWSEYGMRSVTVRDTLSGLDTTSAAWSVSGDGGMTWASWQPLSVESSPGITVPVQVVAPESPGTHLRFRILDMAGNASESVPQALPTTPTITPTPGETGTPTASPTPETTVPAETMTPTATPLGHLMLPLILRGLGG